MVVIKEISLTQEEICILLESLKVRKLSLCNIITLKKYQKLHDKLFKLL